MAGQTVQERGYMGEMKWTRELPTKPGFYWKHEVAPPGFANPDNILPIWVGGGVLRIRLVSSSVAVADYVASVTDSGYQVWWCGPLAAPALPPEAVSNAISNAESNATSNAKDGQ